MTVDSISSSPWRGPVRVQVIGRNEGGQPSDWALLDANDVPHREANRFLRHLRAIERSPNTIRAYAHDLASFLTFLADAGLGLDDVTNEVLGQFARWFRAPGSNVTVLVESETVRERSTTNRSLSTVSSLFTFLGSCEPATAGHAAYARLRASATPFRRRAVSVVDNVGSASRYRQADRLGPRLPRRRVAMRVLSDHELGAVFASCRSDQQRLLISLAVVCGMRLGQILGLRHEDVHVPEREIMIVPREGNLNGARAKCRSAMSIPVPRLVTRLYSNYMHDEYGFVDNDYVFISLRTTRPMTASSVDGIVRGLRRRSGVNDWSLHSLRHTFVTSARRDGVPIDVISRLVTHASTATTTDIYSHLSADDLRAILTRAGAWKEES